MFQILTSLKDHHLYSLHQLYSLEMYSLFPILGSWQLHTVTSLMQLEV